MSASLLVAALLAGLAGGLHCAAMCGGFVVALAGRDAGTQVMRPARAILRGQLAYHAGRIGTYSILGALFGAAGAATLGAIDLAPAQRILYALANLLLLALAFRIATRHAGGEWMSRALLPLTGRALPAVMRATRGHGTLQRVAVGAAWGLVPCTLVYGMLPLALFAGGAWQGAAVMAAFGLATLPNLVGIGWLVQRFRHALRGRALRGAAAGVLTAFALAGLYRVAFIPEALGQGPFCIVP